MEQKEPEDIHFQSLADAICNSHPRQENGLYAHARDRYRGFEGRNGVACKECQTFAEAVLKDYNRIKDNHKKLFGQPK